MSEPIITLDLHGLKQEEAQKMIDNVLSKIDNGTYLIKLIHGFHRGTNLKDMIPLEYRYHPKIKRIIPGENQGTTILVIREL